MRRGKVSSVAHMNMHGHRGGCGNAYGFTGAQDVVTHSMAHTHTQHTHTPPTKHSIQSVRSRHRQRQTQTLRHKFIRVSAPFLFDLHTQTHVHTHTYTGTHTVSWAQACGTLRQNCLLVSALRKAIKKVCSS